MQTVGKTWHLLPHDPDAIEPLARALNVSPIVAQLLLQRRLTEPERARRFLTAPLAGLVEPERLPGAADAARRLLDAVRHQRRICVYGDYDVDGVTGTAILFTLLRMLGGKVEYYVPHRLEEGYGLNHAALGRLAQNGTEVVVTVDCGITSLAEADEARRLGLELIVTDHHEPKSTLPEAAVLVHPRIPQGGNAPLAPDSFGQLSGSGVAFKLAWALCKLECGSDKVTPAYREFLLESVVLAALGTVADVVPLEDENRILVRYGLVRLRRSRSLGVRALLQSAGLCGKEGLAAMDVGYGLAPRLNAAGRLGSARLAVELLTTSSSQRAEELARYLEDQNQERQALERHIFREARALAEEGNGAPALVLASANWHPGLIGIVAGRLAELYHRPVLLIAVREGQSSGQGSGRSIPGFLLHEALQECTESLLSHGGHASAAGFRIDAAAIPVFREQFCAVAGRRLGPEPPARRLILDAEVPLSALTTGLLKALAELEPYGPGNPQPLFLAGNVQVVGEPRRVGRGEQHLSFRARQEGKYLRAIAFGMADRAQELMSEGGRCCLAYSPRFNEWNGFRSVDLEVRDFQPGAQAQLQ
jgi:single-stranded-DNA-specific exonuclease